MEQDDTLTELKRKIEEASDKQAELSARLALAKHLESIDHLQSCIAYDKCHALALEYDDRLAEATTLEGMGSMLWKMADYTKAHQRYQQALDIYTELGELYGMARSYSGLGIISSISEEHSTALEYFEQALSASRRANHDSFTAVLTANVGNVYFALGRYDDAMACYERALDYHEKHDNQEQIAVMLTGMAGVLVYTQQYQQGLALLHRALAIDKKLERSSGVVMCMFNIGETLRKQGKHKEALKQQLDTLKLAEKVNFNSMTYKIHEQLSVLYDLLDEPEKAADHLQLYMQGEQEEKKWQVKKQNEKLQQYRMNKSID